MGRLHFVLITAGLLLLGRGAWVGLRARRDAAFLAVAGGSAPLLRPVPPPTAHRWRAFARLAPIPIAVAAAVAAVLVGGLLWPAQEENRAGAITSDEPERPQASQAPAVPAPEPAPPRAAATTPSDPAPHRLLEVPDDDDAQEGAPAKGKNQGKRTGQRDRSGHEGDGRGDDSQVADDDSQVDD